MPSPRVPERVLRVKIKPPKVAVPPRRRNDITLPPDVIDASRKHAYELRMTQKEWQNAAIKAFRREVQTNPAAYEPAPSECPTCHTPYRQTRASGAHRRLRVAIDYENDAVAVALAWVADTYYRGVRAQAFEAACRFFMKEKR